MKAKSESRPILWTEPISTYPERNERHEWMKPQMKHSSEGKQLLTARVANITNDDITCRNHQTMTPCG